jgi:hypothetical protein
MIKYKERENECRKRLSRFPGHNEDQRRLVEIDNSEKSTLLSQINN